jgi:hypothetical protein
VSKLTQEYLKSILHYCPDTGIFIWLKPTSNRVSVGKQAGSLEIFGYITISINGLPYKAHRLAFLYMLGKFPIEEVDHIDNIRCNNAWVNLRECTSSQNSCNSSPRQDNTSGIRGLYYDHSAKVWKGRVQFEGKIKKKASKDRQLVVNWLEETRANIHAEFKFDPRVRRGE